MILNKIQKDIKILALRLLIAEVILGILIFAVNYFLDLKGIYVNLFGDKFLKYDLFSTGSFLVIEAVIVLMVVWRWQKKYLRFDRGDRVRELLDEGESESMELKTSFRWDLREQKYNKELEKAIVRSIAGFLNSEGGVLIVGATDNKVILGLENDYKTLPKSNRDSWENHLNQTVKNYLGLQLRRLIKVGFSELDGKDVAVIEINKADKPVYLQDGESEQFFLRTGNSTNALSISAATEYISSHWKKKN